MILRTHLAFGVLVGLFALQEFDFIEGAFGAFSFGGVLFFLSVLFFSVFPDIDHGGSFIGRRLWFVSWIFRLLFKHRGVVHSLFFVFIVGFVLWIWRWEAALGAMIGYLGHLLMDGLSKNGVRIFYPLDLRIRGFVRSGGWLENVLFYLILFLIAVLAVLAVQKI